MFWGPGWDGYDASATLADNISNLPFVPDWLWFYKAGEYLGVRDVRIPKLAVFNEAHDVARTLQEIEAADATLVGFHHESDRRLYPQLRTFHVPHCTDTNPESERPICERNNAALLAGVVSSRIYPLRDKYRACIQARAIPGAIRNHPGYRLTTNQQIRQQFAEYMATLADSKILLCCSSIYRYPLAKYIEGAMAGCAIVGDMPSDQWFRDKIGASLIEIDVNDSLRRIADTVLSALSDEQGLQQRSNELRKLAAAEFTLDRYADRILSEMRSA